jgi:broad specificity phosphatase PhoE
MMHARYGLFLLLLGTVSLPVFGQSGEAPTVVLVLRHAETGAGMGQDVPLNDVGQQRARALISVAEDAGVTAIYSSQFQRTRQTVAPLADHLGLPVTTVAVDGATLSTYPQTLTATLLEQHRGETVVVVNHSNTVPPIVEALGGAPVPAIDEVTYDQLFIVVIPSSGPVRTIKTRYGQ